MFDIATDYQKAIYEIHAHILRADRSAHPDFPELDTIQTHMNELMQKVKDEIDKQRVTVIASVAKVSDD